MEPIIKTRFPISKKATKEQVLEIAGNWLQKNRNFRNSFPNQSTLDNLMQEPNFKEKGDQNTRLQKISVDDQGVAYTTLSFEHQGVDLNEFWRTRFSLKQDPENEESEVAIVLEHGSPSSFQKQIRPRKPILIDLLIDGLPSTRDGWIPLLTVPHELVDGDQMPVADFINGIHTQNFLPILYVSRCNSTENPCVDPTILAKKIAGLAHVVIEPNSNFSREIKEMLNSKEMACYDGGVRLYWPRITDPRANKLWTKGFFELDEKMLRGEKDHISVIINHIGARTRGLTPNECSYDFILNLSRRIAINEKLRKIQKEHQTKEQEHETKEQGYEEMTKLYEDSIRDLEGEKTHLESQVERLTHETATLGDDLEIAQMNLQSVERHRQESRQELTDCGANKGEALLALRTYMQTQPQSMSTYHTEKIAQLLKEEKECIAKTEKRIQRAISEIANAFSTYSRMSPAQTSILKKHGFTHRDDGEHYKIVKKGPNENLSVVLAKTPSDTQRSGKNFIRDMKKTFFSI